MTPYTGGIHMVVVKDHHVPVIVFPHEHDCWHWIDEMPKQFRDNYEVKYWPFGSNPSMCKRSK